MSHKIGAARGVEQSDRALRPRHQLTADCSTPFANMGPFPTLGLNNGSFQTQTPKDPHGLHQTCRPLSQCGQGLGHTATVTPLLVFDART